MGGGARERCPTLIARPNEGRLRIDCPSALLADSCVVFGMNELRNRPRTRNIVRARRLKRENNEAAIDAALP